MRFNNLFAIATLLFLSFSVSLLAEDKAYFVEANYNVLDGKATSYLDTARQTTRFVSLSAGKQIDAVKIYLSYDPIRWEDAKADAFCINADYTGKLGNKNMRWYAGGGIGTMKYQGDPLTDTTRKWVGSLRAGIIFEMSDMFYATAGLRYLNANNIKIQDNAYLYSELENMFGANLGIGINF